MEAFGSGGILVVGDRVGFSEAVSLVVFLGTSNRLDIIGACGSGASNASGNLGSSKRQRLSAQGHSWRLTNG